MTDVSKLPAWPDPAPVVPFDAHLKFYYQRDLARAYRARMEALVERMKTHGHHDILCEKAGFRCEDEPCTCGLDALLAACEREEDGR